MKWIKQGDKFLLSREELCTLADFETCLQFTKKRDRVFIFVPDAKNERPANFDDEDVVKIRKNMYKVLGEYMPVKLKTLKVLKPNTFKKKGG